MVGAKSSTGCLRSPLEVRIVGRQTMASASCSARWPRIWRCAERQAAIVARCADTQAVTPRCDEMSMFLCQVNCDLRAPLICDNAPDSRRCKSFPGVSVAGVVI